MSVKKANADAEHGDRPPRVRVASIIVQEGAILLVRHVKCGKTYWLLPGGRVEYGEPVGEALVREVKEETGLDITLGELVFLNDSIPPDGHRHVVNLYFTARIVGGQLAQGPDYVLAEIRFVPLDELPQLEFYPDIRDQLLQAIRAGFPRRALYLGNLWS